MEILGRRPKDVFRKDDRRTRMERTALGMKAGLKGVMIALMILKRIVKTEGMTAPRIDTTGEKGVMIALMILKRIVKIEGMTALKIAKTGVKIELVIVMKGARIG